MNKKDNFGLTKSKNKNNKEKKKYYIMLKMYLCLSRNKKHKF